MIKLIKIIYFIILCFYFLFFPNVNAQEKIKIGLLVPMTGENKEVGESIIKAVELAVKDIDNATSPLANLVNIFEVTPPGAAAIIITPIDISGDVLKISIRM